MIKVFKTKEYRNCPIYFRQIGWGFWEYLIVLNNQIYTAHYIIRPKWWRCFLKETYRKKDVQAILTMITAAAEATIDTIKDDKKRKQSDNRS